MRNFHIIAKPTCACNLNCEYCYDKDSKEKFKEQILTIKDLSHLAGLVSEYAKEIDWLWHGGEPTVVPQDWYVEAQEVFNTQYHTNFVQNLQTNGVNLIKDDSWVDFLKDNGFSVGISFDVFGQSARMRVDHDTLSTYCELINNLVDKGVMDELCIEAQSTRTLLLDILICHATQQ